MPTQPGATEHARLRCETIARIQGSPLVLRALMDVYAAVDAEVASRGAACEGDGRCCRFDLVGHRLYVSPVELALLTLEEPPAPQQATRLRCPYQVGAACTARRRRPLGCRTYFCCEDSTWSNELYEGYHARIRQIHDRAELDYWYSELTASVAGLFSREG
ncbi:MAG: hypothetical protein ACLFV7_09465 [Phycisphaerae bacterium]